MYNTIFSHRSVRKYKKNPVEQQLLDSVLEAGTRASNTGNMQVYSLIVTTDETLRSGLYEAHFKQNMVLEAPVHITFCADIHRFSAWCDQREATPCYDNFLWFCTAFCDAILVSQNVALAAEEAGLGICYLGTAMYNADQIIDLLEIPKGVVPVVSMVMGYPDAETPLTDRLPLEAVVHHEKYQIPGYADIDRFYSDLETSGQTRELLKINKKNTLAQVFTENRYPREANELFSRKYLDTIKKQGFLF